jgi:hypothetical protein
VARDVREGLLKTLVVILKYVSNVCFGYSTPVDSSHNAADDSNENPSVEDIRRSGANKEQKGEGGKKERYTCSIAPLWLSNRL